MMLKRILATLALLSLAACGGGGGGSGCAPFSAGCGNTGGGDPPAVTYSVTVTLSNQTVTSAQPATVTARVVNNQGAAAANQVVTFGTAGGLGTFSAPSALTDANGVATVILSPATATSAGADSVIASTTINTQVVTGSIGFQLTATNVTISAFNADIGNAALGAYGQAQLTVTLAGTNPATPVNVAVTSACVTQGRATLTPENVTTSTGSATFTYRDQGCGAFNATDGLQASVTGTSATASRTISLTAPSVASIAFVSAEPAEIYLRGSGFVENSNVTFQVRDANGLGVPNQSVSLEATTLAGGLLIDGGSVPVTKVTDANGNVLVRINAGTVPTPVRVRATLGSTGVATVSSSLAVAVGLPSQQNFSLSQRTFNIEGLEIDGATNAYTIIASDRLGNPVPEGTAINFIAEGGQVQAIRQTTLSNGLASATANFQSSTPKPTDGRVTVLAYALGEESFLDENGNNVYDAGEDYQDLGDVFLDRLFNGTYNANEDQFVSLSISGNSVCNTASSSLLLLGVNAPSRAITQTGAPISSCVAGWGRAYVRKAVQTVFSGSGAKLGNIGGPSNATTWASASAGALCPRQSIIPPVSPYTPYGANDAAAQVQFFTLGGNTVIQNLGASGSISFMVADNNDTALNPVAAGSTITAAATTGVAANVLSGTPVGNSLVPTDAVVGVAFDDSASSGTITITVRSPSGRSSVISQRVYRNQAPGSVACN